MGAPTDMRRKRVGRLDLTEEMNGLEKGGDANKTAREREGISIGVRGDGDWVASVVVVIFGCLSE